MSASPAPLVVPALDAAILARFWSKVGPHDDLAACWLWRGGVNNKGYPRFCTGRNTQVGARTFAWGLVHDPPPPGYRLYPRCGEALCVNPAHQYAAPFDKPLLRYPSIEARFWRHVDKDGPQMPHMSTRCWSWTGTPNSAGYGNFRGQGALGQTVAHRYSYILHYGAIPAGLLVCHHCDYKMCVRPDHFFLGTHQDNSDDYYAKGYDHTLRGEKHNRARMTDKTAREAFRRVHAGESIAEVAESYGVHYTTIRRIALGTRWRHLDLVAP